MRREKIEKEETALSSGISGEIPSTNGVIGGGNFSGVSNNSGLLLGSLFSCV